MANVINSILLYVADIGAAADFYQKLGFELKRKTDMLSLMQLGDVTIQCYDQSKLYFKSDAEAPKGAGVFIYIQTDDVDAMYRQLIEAGLTPSSEPKDWDWGNREFAIKDPDGYRIVFYKPLGAELK